MEEKERKSHLGEVRRGRPRKLDESVIPDNELKKLINNFGYTGTAEELNKRYGVNVHSNTVRNYAKKLGLKVSAHDIKDGQYLELLDVQAFQYLNLDNIKHVGLKIGNGIDVRCEYKGTPIYTESRNWGSGQIDRTVVKERVNPRFEKAVSKYGKDGIKILQHSKDLKVTRGAKELLEERGIVYLPLGHKKVTRKNWVEYLDLAILKIGLLLNKLLGYPLRDILFALRRAKQEKGNQNNVFALIDALIELEAFELCIDDDLRFQDQGGGQSRVRSGLKSILEGCGKVLGLVKSVGKNIGKSIGNVSKLVEKIGWRRFVLDESARLGLVENIKNGGESLRKEDENLESLVDRLLNGVADLSDSIKELAAIVSAYNEEVGRLDKVAQKIEKMNKEVQKGIRAVRKRYQTKELVKSALKGADMGEIIKMLDNTGKIKRLEKELRELEEKKGITFEKMLEKALKGDLTVGELDEIQRREARKERLRREITILEKEGMGETGKRKKIRDEFGLVRVM